MALAGVMQRPGVQQRRPALAASVDKPICFRLSTSSTCTRPAVFGPLPLSPLSQAEERRPEVACQAAAAASIPYTPPGK